MENLPTQFSWQVAAVAGPEALFCQTALPAAVQQALALCLLGSAVQQLWRLRHSAFLEWRRCRLRHSAFSFSAILLRRLFLESRGSRSCLLPVSREHESGKVSRPSRLDYRLLLEA